MRKLFWTGLLGLIVFEILNVYFIMPMPGSQRMDSITLAYFLYKWRWVFRTLFGIMIVVGLLRASWHPKRKWLLLVPIVALFGVIYMANFKMAADAMFEQPKQVILVPADQNKVDSNRLVVALSVNGEAKAYPIRFLGYHHHVQDTVGGQPIMVTYCTVCRTGRIFEPIVNGKKETFRLVGMDHFNAMLEDATTKSWWRQETGEAITGPLKGQHLPEVFSTQTSLAAWVRLHPNTLIMQPDPDHLESYDTTMKYEMGKSTGSLTRTDSLSWEDKSWVVGVKVGKERKAYDWKQLKTDRLIQDNVNNIPLLIALATDDKSFFAFERPTVDSKFSLLNDTLTLGNHRYRIDGKGIDTSYTLKSIPAYQEFWHSWKTFNPETQK